MSASPPQSPPKKSPRVFTIPAGLPFVDVLAAGIFDFMGSNPAALARVTVLVPTRRARRSLAEAFLRQSEGRPLLLPRMTALGDLDEDKILIADGFGAEDGAPAADSIAVKPAVSGLRRQLLLTRLVLAGPGEANPNQAAHLALELARFLDQVHTERLSFDGLEGLVSGAFSKHWQETLKFLKILTEEWPEVLADEDALDAADRRNRLFDAQARAWIENPPTDPVIAAGSTGSIPATADLLAVVARLPEGRVVLPGLDLDATPNAWAALQESHPQFGMARLLERLDTRREDVKPWKVPGYDWRPSDRARMVNAALVPATAEPLPPLGGKETGQALNSISRINCPGLREEAAVIALIMRRTLEEPGKTAALVTPDRGLARRVEAELRRWRIEVDDSAGIPLARTPSGAFLRLTARMAADDLAPVPLLAALKHPLAAGGLTPGGFRAQVRELEIAVLRGPRPGPGIEGLLGALKTNRGLDKKTLTSLQAFLNDLKKTISPFAKTLQGKPKALPEVVSDHVRMAEALAATGETEGAVELWAGDAGEAAANFVAELRDAAKDFGAVTAADYPALLDTLMAGRVVRPRYGRHPRLHIWGLLEARLQQADVMILGGLNENTWPPEAKASPWMNRSMLKEFGLPSPERIIGLQAHDFTQTFSAPHVVLTRSDRVDGTPQVPSRWLLRLDNLLERMGREDAFKAPECWLDWTAGLDEPAESRQVADPRPTPPVDARPRQLSVTQVEHWIRDPYVIYARHVLRLDPLPPIDAEPGAADWGIIIHAVLHEFLGQYGDALPGNAERRLLEIGRKVFDDFQVPPDVDAFWWPRFERIAGWFIEYERTRREAGFRNVATEKKGKMVLDGLTGPFTLTARADRIDHHADIGLSVMDYKTGQEPSWPQVKTFLAPQLPLEAAIAEAGGFKGIDKEEVAQFVYLKLTGGREPGKEKVFAEDMADVIDATVTRLTKLIYQYDDPAMPYLSQPRPMLLELAGDYDHLARVLEWRGRAEDGA